MALLLGVAAGCAAPTSITKLVDGRLIETRSISPRAYEHAARAMTYEEEDRYQDAVLEYKAALQYDAQSPELNARLAEALLELDDFPQAQAAIDRSMAIEPTVDGVVAASHLALHRGDAKGAAAALARALPLVNFSDEAEAAERVYLEQADAFIMALQPDKAMASLEVLLSGLPTSQLGLYRQACIAWALGDLPASRRYLERLVQVEPEHLEARLLLARLYTVLQKNDDARAAYVEALSRSEGDLSVAALYAGFLQQQGLHEDAVTLASQMQIAEVDATTLSLRMELERVVGRLPEALQMADAVLATAPDPPLAGRVLLAKGVVLEASHRPEEAARAFAAIGEGSPSFTEARLHAAALAREQGKNAEAQALLDPLAVDTLDEAMQDEVLVARALVAASAGRLDEGRKMLQTSDQASSPRIALARAVLEDKYGDWKQALALSESVLSKELSSAEALNFWAFVAAEKKYLLPTALARAQAALALDPGSPAIMDTLGWIHLQLDNPEKARPFLEGAAIIDPSDPEILSHVAALNIRLGKLDLALVEAKRALELCDDTALRKRLEALQKTASAGKAVSK